MREKIYNTIHDIFKNYKGDPNIEIEFRLGWKGSSDIGKSYYDKIKEQLQSCIVWDNTNFLHAHEFHFNKFRQSVNKVDNNITTIKKTRILVNDIILNDCPFDLRISVCSEIPVDNISNNVTFSRKKFRNTYIYKMWKYDLTHYIVDDNFVDPFNDTNQTFGFEIEYIPYNDRKNDLSYLTHSIIGKIFDIAYINFN